MVEALELSLVVLDAFHEAVQPGLGQQAPVHREVVSLPAGASTHLTWEQPWGGTEAYEVAVVITAVRFADGSVWRAPKEELVDIF